jgi:glyoxylase-like metal-dependent hydrolase (beta-lactamase superfamily II)
MDLSYTSDHFELKQLAAGVYAALASPLGGAFSNAGIVDLGEQTLVFDAFETPNAAQDLRAAAEHLTERPVTSIIISHSHADHWLGAQAFDSDMPIITTHIIREEITANIGWLKQNKEDPSELEEEIERMGGQLETETDPRRQATLEFAISRMSHMLAALPTLEFRFPSVTFDRKLTFHGPRRSVELVEVAPGHTGSDAYLLLPDEDIMFMGDLGFFQSQPFLVYADPPAWAAWLEAAEQSAVETFVPGHGPLGSRTDLVLERQYITALQELVARTIHEGGTVEEALEQTLPSPFDAWVRDSAARWEANVRTLYERLSAT